MQHRHHSLFHISKIASQFRILAEWIEQHGITPWHIEYDWNQNHLVIHIDNSIMLQIFPLSTPISDSIGITWKTVDEGLHFQSFSTHQRTDFIEKRRLTQV